MVLKPHTNESFLWLLSLRCSNPNFLFLLLQVNTKNNNNNNNNDNNNNNNNNKKKKLSRKKRGAFLGWKLKESGKISVGDGHIWVQGVPAQGQVLHRHAHAKLQWWKSYHERWMCGCCCWIWGDSANIIWSIKEVGQRETTHVFKSIVRQVKGQTVLAKTWLLWETLNNVHYK